MSGIKGRSSTSSTQQGRKKRNITEKRKCCDLQDHDDFTNFDERRKKRRGKDDPGSGQEPQVRQDQSL